MPFKEELISEKELRKKTFISFSVFILLVCLAILGWKWLHTQPDIAAAPEPIRKVLNFNEGLFSNLYSNNKLAKTYPLSVAVKKVRVNGNAGLNKDFDASTWKLKVARAAGDTLYITLDEIKALPKTEIVFDFKCIEGWSQVTHWGGVKFSDFAKKYNLTSQTQMHYVGMETPDKGYYVGNDMPAMMHPQTLLCYEMNDKPLPMNNGYPLRLIIPVKYGVKHLKRIGTIFFSNERPRDYWYEKGYDYYCGL